MKACPHGPEIKARLLLPCYRALLQKYIDRWKIDPEFLFYHRESITLALREEPGCSSLAMGLGCGCHSVRLVECCMADTLRDAMEDRMTEQEL